MGYVTYNLREREQESERVREKEREIERLYLWYAKFCRTFAVGSIAGCNLTSFPAFLASQISVSTLESVPIILVDREKHYCNMTCTTNCFDYEVFLIKVIFIITVFPLSTC